MMTGFESFNVQLYKQVGKLRNLDDALHIPSDRSIIYGIIGAIVRSSMSNASRNTRKATLLFTLVATRGSGHLRSP